MIGRRACALPAGACTVALAFTLLSGCVSQLTVTKAAPGSAGIRYFLPQPFILVTPHQDGTITVDKLFLPDPDNEYAITASSLLGNYKLDIRRDEQGFLEQVAFQSDSGALARDMTQAAGAIAVQARNAAASDRQAADKEQTRETQQDSAAREAAGQALRGAQLALDIALGKAEVLAQRRKQANPPSNLDAQILAATLAVEEARIRRDAALLANNTVASRLATLPLRADEGRPRAPEPVFFKVDMTPSSVTLAQAFAQRDHVTWQAPRATALEETFTVLPGAQVLRPTDKSPALTATVKADRALTALHFKGIASVPPGASLPALQPVLSLRPDRATLDIELPKGMAAGDYAVTIGFDSGPLEAPRRDTRTVLVRIER